MASKRIYPRICKKCKKNSQIESVFNGTMDCLHDGIVYKVNFTNIPVKKCTICKQVIFCSKSDKPIDIQERDTIGILQFDEVSKILISCGISLTDISKKTGIHTDRLSLIGSENTFLMQTRNEDIILRRLQKEQESF